ncbi:hypothetical protein Micbo1qcDRAFT_178696 [Microdochium bolleyi]|uniref:Uncharacterized protein n=1 Tax=Microdochium bolleyi TaxID=196109 RepID=A0A136IT03_9PEZI|nr:hypothetical protein Micbo1qcDRAFT_178696 [Microdochium bolleyi]
MPMERRPSGMTRILGLSAKGELLLAMPRQDDTRATLADLVVTQLKKSINSLDESKGTDEYALAALQEILRVAGIYAQLLSPGCTELQAVHEETASPLQSAAAAVVAAAPDVDPGSLPAEDIAGDASGPRAASREAREGSTETSQGGVEMWRSVASRPAVALEEKCNRADPFGSQPRDSVRSTQENASAHEEANDGLGEESPEGPEAECEAAVTVPDPNAMDGDLITTSHKAASPADAAPSETSTGIGGRGLGRHRQNTSVKESCPSDEGGAATDCSVAAGPICTEIGPSMAIVDGDEAHTTMNSGEPPETGDHQGVSPIAQGYDGTLWNTSMGLEGIPAYPVANETPPDLSTQSAENTPRVPRSSTQSPSSAIGRSKHSKAASTASTSTAKGLGGQGNDRDIGSSSVSATQPPVSTVAPVSTGIQIRARTPEEEQQRKKPQLGARKEHTSARVGKVPLVTNLHDGKIEKLIETSKPFDNAAIDLTSFEVTKQGDVDTRIDLVSCEDRAADKSCHREQDEKANMVSSERSKQVALEAFVSTEEGGNNSVVPDQGGLDNFTNITDEENHNHAAEQAAARPFSRDAATHGDAAVGQASHATENDEDVASCASSETAPVRMRHTATVDELKLWLWVPPKFLDSWGWFERVGKENDFFLTDRYWQSEAATFDNYHGQLTVIGHVVLEFFAAEYRDDFILHAGSWLNKGIRCEKEVYLVDVTINDGASFDYLDSALETDEGKRRAVNHLVTYNNANTGGHPRIRIVDIDWGINTKRRIAGGKGRPAESDCFGTLVVTFASMAAANHVLLNDLWCCGMRFPARIRLSRPDLLQCQNCWQLGHWSCVPLRNRLAISLRNPGSTSEMSITHTKRRLTWFEQSGGSRNVPKRVPAAASHQLEFLLGMTDDGVALQERTAGAEQAG